MAQNDYLKPRGVDLSDLSRRSTEDGQFRNPPMYMDIGGFTSASKAKLERNHMTLEKGGPQAVRGRPL